MVQEGMPQFQLTVLGVLYLTIGSLGTYANGSLLMRYIRSPDVPGHQRLLHISLALGNLGVVLGFPFSGSSSLAGRWLFGTVGCQAYAFEGMVSGIVSILTIAALSVERYFAAKEPQFLKDAKLRCYLLVLSYIWLKSTLFASLPLTGWARYAPEPPGISCTLDWLDVDGGYISYYLTVTSFAFVIPLGIAMVCLAKAKRAESANDIFASVSKGEDKLNETDLRKIVWRLLVMALIAWTPYALLLLQFVVQDPRSTPATVAAVPPLFAKAVTSLMPAVYKTVKKHKFETKEVDKTK